MSASTTTKRAGSYSAKLNYTTGQDRVEVTTANGDSTDGQYGVNGAVNWYGWSMHIPSGISADNWTILAQFHYHTPGHIVNSLTNINGSGNSPTRLSLSTTNNLRLSLFNQVGSTQKTDTTYDMGTGLINFDAWNDFVVETKWAYDNTGYFRLWVNGVKRLDLTGVSTYFNNPYGPRFKAGAYKGAGYSYTGSGFNVYFDEYRHGNATSSYNEVKPGSGVGLGGIYRIKNSYTNRSLRPLNSGTADNTAIIQHTDNASWTSEQWKVMLTKNGLYRIDNVFTGKSLRVASAAEDAPATQYTWSLYDSQRWNLVQSGTSWKVKNSSTNKVLRPLDASTDNDAAVVQTTDSNWSSQLWNFVP
jgi:Polysaccharide lyase/Ricin-type beta-trefoil lectin domain-like